MKTKRRTIPWLVFLLSGPALLAAPLGTVFTYQGRLTEAGNDAHGIYDLQFALYNVPAAGAPIGTALVLPDVPVTNGLFTVPLDFGPGAFTGDARWLEIAVRPGASSGAFTPLTPRQPLTGTPYALFAPTAGGVSPGAITSNMLAQAAVAAVNLATGAVTSVALADTIALGGANIDGRLDVFRTTANTAAISLIGSVNQLRIFADDGLEKTRLDATPGWGQLQLNNSSTIGQRAAILTANATGGGSLTLYNSNGQDRAVLFGGNAGGLLDLFNSLGTNTVALLGNGSQISTYGSDGLEQIRLWGPAYGELLLNNSLAGNQTAVFLSANGAAGGELRLNNTSGVVRASLSGGNSGGFLSLLAGNGLNSISASGAAGQLSLANASGSSTIFLDGRANTLSMIGAGGNTAIQLAGNSSQISTFGSDGLEQIRLYGPAWGEILLFDNAGNDETVRLSAGGDGGGFLTLRNASGSDRVVLTAQGGGGAGEISVRDASGTETVEILGAESSAEGGQIRLNRANGTASIVLDGDLNGEGRITTQVLQITGGADLSEQFDIAALRDAVQPGMVVCIDPQRPGRLTPSARAYDRKVAGIVSGAGGVKPGMLMGQHGTPANGQYPVALTGRVYCQVDADHGPIEPGDLITTSDTPGHGMKVTDHTRAQGAILGKAMTALPAGRGLVLVLVSLQ